MNKKILIGSIIAVVILVLMSFNPVINAQVCKYSVKERLMDIREEIINILEENDWKDIFQRIILVVFLLCIGIIETYISTIEYNEDNDLYPILTKLFKKIFMIPMLFLTYIVVLIGIIFDPIPYPE